MTQNNDNNEKEQVKKEDRLLDELAVFITQYKHHVEPQSRSSITNLLENLISLVYQYRDKYIELNKEYEANKLLNQYYIDKILKLESNFDEIKSKLNEILILPFRGKTSEQANKRLGMDEGLHMALEIIEEILKENNQ